MNLDMQIVITGAFRYALGRMTYVVDSTCNVIEATASEMDTNQIILMVREIKEADSKDALGMDMDKQRWHKCRDILLAEYKSRELKK